MAKAPSSRALGTPDEELLAGAGDATGRGGLRPIDRVGLPMLHRLFEQFNEDRGSQQNAGRAADDLATAGQAVGKAIAGVVAANGTCEGPACDNENVARRSFPNVLPHAVGTPATSGFVEWKGDPR